MLLTTRQTCRVEPPNNGHIGTIASLERGCPSWRTNKGMCFLKRLRVLHNYYIRGVLENRAAYKLVGIILLMCIIDPLQWAWLSGSFLHILAYCCHLGVQACMGRIVLLSTFEGSYSVCELWQLAPPPVAVHVIDNYLWCTPFCISYNCRPLGVC